jgi:hypothetical protein
MSDIITLEDTLQSAVVKMAKGNPGALTVLCNLVKFAPLIDPQNIMGGFSYILIMDGKGIYGSRIWMLFKDICNQDYGRMCAILRAVQLGFIFGDSLSKAIEGEVGAELNEDLLKKVQERLPGFKLTGWEESL